MSLADIFRDCHGALDKSALIPFAQVAGKKPKGYNKLPSKKEFNAFVKLVGISPEEIFFDPGSFINPIVYLSGYIYQPIHHFSPEANLMFKTAERIQGQKRHFHELEKEKDYISIFEYMDKKLLIPTYVEIFDKIPDNQKYEIFVALHVRSEYGFEMFDHDFLKKIFSFQKFSKERPKRMRELKKLAGIKYLSIDPYFNRFTVYHGHNKNHDPKDEYSWTLNEHTASFFANRFNTKGMITKKIINFDQVIDFFNQRDEAEVILLDLK
jgi:hypothetical protein